MDNIYIATYEDETTVDFYAPSHDKAILIAKEMQPIDDGTGLGAIAYSHERLVRLEHVDHYYKDGEELEFNQRIY